ncbi:DUF6973 domain-containing protein [Nocardia harenae]|uniref:DUF6973 domain-containing protein n=1 Tax=Nocardia harenae TaxID=358707 RepID=UPI000829B1EF|nr:hypothetical protein [Nocardia harenae]
MSGGSYTTPITVPLVLSWNPSTTIAMARAFADAADKLDEETQQSASAVDSSYDYFKGDTAEAVRTRSAQDRDHARRTAQVFTEIQQQIFTQLAEMSGFIETLRTVKAEAEASNFDFFVWDDGAVDSRMSNTEVLLKFGATGLAEKEAYELFLTGRIRTALTAIQQIDLEGAEKIKRELENLPAEVSSGVTRMPSDPELADILRRFQTAPSDGPATLWPSGVMLERIRALNPDFQPILMTPDEIALLSSRLGASGPLAVRDISDFFEIKAEAESTAREVLPEHGQSDGHGDAFRHMYWNALMTQRYGEDWTQRYATAHEELGAAAPTREAMDLYNNSIGRQIALDNPDATPDQLQGLITDRIRAGDAIVLDDTGQIEWSDRVALDRTGAAPRLDIPLPEGSNG